MERLPDTAGVAKNQNLDGRGPQGKSYYSDYGKGTQQ